MVNGPGTGDAVLGRWLVVEVARTAVLTAGLPALAAVGEAERLEQAAAGVRPRGVGAHAVEALERVLGRHLGVLGDQRVVAHVRDEQLVVEALGIGEQQVVALALDLDAGARQSLGPEVDRLRPRDAPHDAVDHPVAGASRHGARVLEERQVEAGVGVLVAVEEVVDGRVVLVDGLLHEPQPEHAHVEVDVALRVACDRRDVVDAVELHRCARNYIRRSSARRSGARGWRPRPGQRRAAPARPSRPHPCPSEKKPATAITSRSARTASRASLSTRAMDAA